MNWLRDLHQNLSFKLGYVRGHRGKPFSCPWWADQVVYAMGHMEGYKLYLADR